MSSSDNQGTQPARGPGYWDCDCGRECRHKEGPQRLPDCRAEWVSTAPALTPTAAPRFPAMRVRRFPDNEIGIRINDIEYVMPIATANELIGMINAASHSQSLNWAGTGPEISAT